MVMAVSDTEILAAQRELAKLEGIFADPASATVLAGLVKLAGRQRLNLRDEVVLVITGSGLKSMETVECLDIPVRQTSLSRLDKTLRLIGA
jgi:threonine synthase